MEIPLCSYKVYHKEGGNVAHIYSLSYTAHLLYYLPIYELGEPNSVDLIS